MELKVALKLCLLLVSSSYGYELRRSPSVLHWLRILAADPISEECKKVDAGTPTPDTTDCHKYYVCTDKDTGTYVGPITCPEGECFDGPTTFRADLKCIPIVADDTCGCDKFTPAGGDCKTVCDKAYDHIAFSDDCSKHAICLVDGADSAVFEAYCPSEKPYFDGTVCGDDKAKCCNCQAPTCTEGGALLPDPTDCHSYYVCMGSADPFEAVKLTCEEGGSFVSGKCDPSTKECENICDIGGDGSSTTPTGGSTTPAGGSTTPNSDSTTPTGDSTPTTTTGDGCTDVADFTCLEKGFYARCPFCDPSYFKCDNAASTPRIGHCAGDLVFNPTPEFAYCVRPENCPFGL